MVVSNETVINNLLGQTLAYSLLGKILYEEIDKERINSLIELDVFDDAPFGVEQENVQKGIKILKEWTEKFAQGISEKELELLKRDHLYLFTGVGKSLAPIWESLYFSEELLLFQEQTFQVRTWYSKYNLQVEKLNNEPDDHLGLELLFLEYLSAQALKALENEQLDSFKRILLDQYEFLTQHPLGWVKEWNSRIQRHAKSDFYLGIANLTTGTLLASSEFLSSTLQNL